MADKKAFYLTTTLPYVNADPHIGFALEIVHADIQARYRALMGDEVFFNTGTDEHGQKIFETAHKAGKDTQAYVDEYAAKFRDLKETLGLMDEIHFIRTTDAHHKAAAQEIWRRCEQAGDIYKKKYKGLYCVGDEMFLRESDLVEGHCPNHPNLEPIMLEEENYFFKLSAYQEKLLAYFNREGVIVPEWRRQEAINFVKSGLEDLSISREKERLSWGVPVPGDDSQVMYVWFDALTNYISTLGWPEDTAGSFKKFWTDGFVMQMAGKDQVRFQSIIWQAMLMSAQIKNTDTVLYHGFITSGGQKMSKSLGNVIGPSEIVSEYGTEALRYFLARHVHSYDDSDVTIEKFKEAYNANLANGLGNLVSRVTKLAADNLEKGTRPEAAGFPGEYTEAIEKYELNKAMDHVWQRIGALDERITHEAPFKLIKTDKEAATKIIFDMTQELYLIGRMLNPFMPETSAKIKEAIIENKKPENLFARKE
jgi:methionyl-tRNA synthetase